MTGADAYRRFQATPYFASLDGLRCLSIAAVVWHHSTPRQLDGLLGRGHLGVHLFFAISGFLITTLLLRERRDTGSIALSRFYLRRTRRIFPLYYLVLVLHVAFVLALSETSPERGHFLTSLPFFATYTTNWFVDFGVAHHVLFAFSWSLAAEEQFYLGWPLLLRKLGRRGLAVATVACLIVVDQLAEQRLLGAILPRGSLIETVVTSFVPAIGLGALAALLVDHEPTFIRIHALLGRAFSAPLALGAVIALAAWPVEPFVVFCAALSAVVVACSITPDHGLRWPLDLPAVRYLGVVSYGIYLFHVPVIGAVRALWPELREISLAVFAIASPLTLAAAALSYRFFERPIITGSGVFGFRKSERRFRKQRFQTN